MNKGDATLYHATKRVASPLILIGRFCKGLLCVFKNFKVGILRWVSYLLLS